MTRIISILFVRLFSIMAIPVSSQSLPMPDISALAEEMVSRLDDEVQESEIYDQLLLRFTEPLDLNTATEEDLRSLYVFSENQINNFLRYRERTGILFSVLELQGLPLFDVGFIRTIMPFVTVRASTFNGWKNLPTRIARKGHGYFLYRSDGTMINRIQSSSTGDEIVLPGSSFSGSFRFLISRPGDFRIGWNADRDRGEKFLWSPRNRWYGFDFNSFHIQLLDKPGIKNLIIGDFSASFGQGLVLGGGFGVGKGTDPVSAVRRASAGFRPFSSLSETGFFRGAAFSIPLNKKWMVHGMFSRTLNDGQIRFDGDSMPFIQSRYTSGIHRSAEEQALRKTWRESNLAAVVSLKDRNIEAGAVINQQILSIPLVPLENVYSYFKFRGSRNLTGSLFLNGRYRNCTGFFESAVSFPSGKLGGVGGVLASLTPGFDVSFLYRHYEPGFQSFHSTAFSENTTTSSEKGIFIGWKYRHGRKFQLSGYTDFFQSLSLKYRLYKPSEGQEYSIRLQRNFSKKNLLIAQYRAIRKERNSGVDESSFFETIPVLRHVGSIQFDYSLISSLSGRTRLLNTFVRSPEKSADGYMIIQDLFLDMGKIDLTWRYSLFAADDYESRLYAYERDVWLSYSFPSWYGYGSRMYLLAEFSLSEKLSAWIKWSSVYYTDSTPSENGLDESSGRYRADLRLQFKWSL